MEKKQDFVPSLLWNASWSPGCTNFSPNSEYNSDNNYVRSKMPEIIKK
jgi:hypothetical protein